MRSTSILGKMGLAALCATALVAACKSSTAQGDTGGKSDTSSSGSMSSGASGSGSTSATAGGADAGASSAGQAGSTMGAAGSSAGQAAGDAANSAGSTAAGAANSAGSSAAGAANSAGSAASGAAGSAGQAAGDAAAGAAGSAGADAGAAAAGGQLNDAQIAAIALAANKVDMDAGNVARKKTKNAKVKAFAKQMVRDHKSANASATALAQKLGVTPEENDTSRQLKQGGDDNLANLKGMTGKDFDRAYIDHEVTYHQAVLSALDDKLIPGAQNADLKALLQKVRGVVAEHLQHAQSLQQEMGGASDSGSTNPK